MAVNTKAKRAAALGFGLSFALVLPPASTAISIEMAGHALSAYEFDLPAPIVVVPVRRQAFVSWRNDRVFDSISVNTQVFDSWSET